MTPRLRWDRTSFVYRCVGLAGLVALAVSVGCTSSLVLPNNPEKPAGIAQSEAAPEPDDGTLLIKEVAAPFGVRPSKVEGVALVTGLHGTGSDPPPSGYRTTLLADMQAHDVKNPNQVLASPNTSLVLVRALLPAGLRKGDRFDIEICVPNDSGTTSLRDGWLMQTRLREMAVLDNTLHTGRVEAVAEGAVLVDSIFEGAGDHANEVRGRVIGGGVAMTSRTLGLVVQSENHSVKTSSLIGTAINARFHTYDRGVKKGAATPQRDNYVELEIHGRYRFNVARYVDVIQNIALSESPVDRLRRIETLERKLLEPSTAASAAMQLEAIGKEGLPPLHKAVKSTDSEVRFYAAEALAYLDEAVASEPLALAAREEPVFRWNAIAALCAMDHVSAYDALTELLHVPSAETRYAAFRALRTRNPLDPLVKGEPLADQFTLHVINTSGPPMIHFSRSRYPEIVLFGDDQELQPPAGLNAGKLILLKGDGRERIRVTRFAPRQEDRRETTSTKLSDVIRTIARVGGGYAEVLEALQEGKQKGYLDSRVVIDALPRGGRAYRRESDDAEEVAAVTSTRRLASPLPELFNLRGSARDIDRDAREEDKDDVDAPARPKGKMWEDFQKLIYSPQNQK